MFESVKCSKMFPKVTLLSIAKHVQEFGLVVLLIFLCCYVSCVQGFKRFTTESCSSLTPQQTTGPGSPPDNFELYQQQTPPGWRRGNGGLKRTKRQGGYDPPPPVILTVPGRGRYRRNNDVYVRVEGRGYYDGLILQARVVAVDGNLMGGRVGLVGHFDLSGGSVSKRNFTYMECFRQPYATVVDGGLQRYGNMSFLWKAPEADKGNIRFAAGITQGIFNWVIVSKILEFNPFPISTVQCGATDACFRVCPLDTSDERCASYEALLMYSYNTEMYGRRDAEFTLGGRLTSPQTNYIAVVYAEDNENLYQADVVACYWENGRAQIAHLLLDTVGAPLILNEEELSLDDYDYDNNMLWCRYRRSLRYSESSYISPYKSFYTLLYKGELNLRNYPKFVTPNRMDMYSTDQRLNLTTPLNRVYAGSTSLFTTNRGSLPAFVSIILILKEGITYF